LPFQDNGDEEEGDDPMEQDEQKFFDANEFWALQQKLSFRRFEDQRARQVR
jgi:hypothetical protein